jgi:hypothetical protein
MMFSAGEGMLVLEQHWNDVIFNLGASIGEKSRTPSTIAAKKGRTAKRSTKSPKA